MSAERTIVAEPPKSDVSVWVGLVGVLSLAVWVLFCRNWPLIVDAFDLDVMDAQLSGPNAAVAGMLFAGAMMAAWSVFVEKVHRNPSTGLDWDNPRPLNEVIHASVTKLAGLWATWAVIGLLYCVGRWYWSGEYLFAMELIAAAAIPLFVLSVPYVLWLDRVMKEPRDAAWHFGAMLINRENWDIAEVKKHWRAWGIKGFFTAFMLAILPFGFTNVVNADISQIAGDPARTTSALLDVMFTIDVMIGTVGYLLTFRPLDAHIRSGNPSLAGWVAALICYPPFVNGMLGGGGVVVYEVNTADWSYWLQGHTVLLWAWAGWLVFLTGVYAWATVAFGIRFSNLTYRGVLTNGPYRYSRHPAYLTKNLFWWCSIMPFAVTNGNPVDMIRNTFFLGVVSAIYYWRARTEEAHMLAEDPKYRAYYDWMSEHGLVTGRMTQIARLLHRRPPALHPAE